MSCSGWMGRLRLAARALDLRLKLDPMQTVCHGDAKGANVVYACGGQPVPLVYDFQCVLRSRRRARVTNALCMYCGKAAAAKDLAYFCNVEAPESEEEMLLQHYHSELSRLLQAQGDTPPRSILTPVHNI